MEFLTENENEIIRNIHHSNMFIQDSFEVLNMAVGITFIVGRPLDPTLIDMLINPEKLMVQSVKFAKPAWDLDGALEWLRDNQRHFKTSTAARKYAADLKSIDAVEIFSAGTWNGDKYTNKDLDEMVNAFNETSESIRPFLKLGHSDKQALLESEGLPAAGWVGKIYRNGSKLMADFIDIPNKIYELIENKAYRKVSVEIYSGVKIKDKNYNLLIGAIALLGAETPGVMNLSDILSRFGLKGYDSIKSYASSQNDVKINEYSIENEININKGDPMQKTENEIALEIKLKQANEKLDQANTDNKTYKADIETKDNELKDVKEANKEALKTAQEMELKAFNIEIEKQADSLVASKTITKAMRPYAVAMLKNETDQETKKFSLTIDKEEKTLDRFELLKEFSALASKASDVNFDDSSEEGQKPVNDEEIKINKYMADNDGVSYSDAYRAVSTATIEA